MNKNLRNILLGVFVLGVAGGVAWVAWQAARKPSAPSPMADFDPDTLIERFDRNADGVLSRDEFDKAYGSSLVLHNPADGVQLEVGQAFAQFDTNRDGRIDEDDIERYKAGVVVPDEQPFNYVWFGRELLINKQQHGWAERELTAWKMGDLPFQGQYFARRYFGPYSLVTLSDGTSVEGYVSAAEGGTVVLSPGAKLSYWVKEEIASVESLPDSPFSWYGLQVASPELMPDDSEASLEIARGCVARSLTEEAKVFYRRVLIRDGQHPEALAALGLRRDGARFVPAPGKGEGDGD